MAAAREVVVLSGVRTPIGNYGGSLKDFSPATLGAMEVAFLTAAPVFVGIRRQRQREATDGGHRGGSDSKRFHDH